MRAFLRFLADLVSIDCICCGLWPKGLPSIMAPLLLLSIRQVLSVSTGYKVYSLSSSDGIASIPPLLLLECATMTLRLLEG